MPVKIGGSYVSEAAASYAKAQAEEGKSDSDILKGLSDKFPNMKFTVGTKPFSGMGINNVSISPKILKQMENDPEKRLEYEALIYDIANTDLAQGRKLKAGGFIIGDDGGLKAWSISEPNDGNRKNIANLNKNDKKSWIDKMLGNATKKKKSSPLKEAQEKLLEKAKEKADEKVNAAVLEISKEGKALSLNEVKDNIAFANANELSKYLFQNFDIVKQGMSQISSKYLRDCVTDADKRQALFDNLSAADDVLKERQGQIGFQGMKITIDEKGETSMESSKSTVGFNGEKIKRIMAAAATKDDMKVAIELLEQDIEELENGLKNNMCDEAEVQKAKDMMKEAKQTMSTLPERPSTPEEKTALTINMVI
ncbi:MAG: hypothetical protein IKN12_10735 [Selenomonadaceae bacterium]|nr:hypothetical protein [Selenomonadaceae bacterium]